MISRILPTRKEEPGPIADLDAIVAEAVPFKFQGRIHFVKPITLREFISFTAANASFHQKMGSDEALTADSLAEAYAKVLSSVCDTITKKHILEMEQAQVAALYQLIIDVVTGQVKTGAEPSKKKRLRLPIYDSVSLRSSQSADGSSDGP